MASRLTGEKGDKFYNAVGPTASNGKRVLVGMFERTFQLYTHKVDRDLSVSIIPNSINR